MSQPPPPPTPQAPAPPKQWTTRTLLEWISGALAGAGVGSPKLCAEMLVAHVLECERLRLYMEADRPASEPERTALRDLVRRALRHEPVQYLVGTAWFFGLQLKVDRRVLIPRPCTELIVETVLQRARAQGRADGAGPAIADVATGSGAIALALAKNLADANVLATDLSEPALEVARLNAATVGLGDRVEFVQGDLLAPLADRAPVGGFGAIVSNPPYIPDAEWEDVAANVREHEPESALRAGPDGLQFIAPIVSGAAEYLAPGGVLLVECAASNAHAAAEMAREHSGYADVRVLDDHEGLPRVLHATRQG